MLPQLHDERRPPRLRTSLGVPVGRPRLSPEARAAVRAQLESGPTLAAHDAEIDLVVDVYAHIPSRSPRLVTIAVEDL